MKTKITIIITVICLAVSCSYQEIIPDPDTKDSCMQPLSLSVLAAADVSKSLITGTSLSSGTQIGVSVYGEDGGRYVSVR